MECEVVERVLHRLVSPVDVGAGRVLSDPELQPTEDTTCTDGKDDLIYSIRDIKEGDTLISVSAHTTGMLLRLRLWLRRLLLLLRLQLMLPLLQLMLPLLQLMLPLLQLILRATELSSHICLVLLLVSLCLSPNLSISLFIPPSFIVMQFFCLVFSMFLQVLLWTSPVFFSSVASMVFAIKTPEVFPAGVQSGVDVGQLRSSHSGSKKTQWQP